MNDNNQQYVYVMSNPSFPEDMLKIGWTREHPNIRANDLHTTGIPMPFIVEFVIITLEGSKLEKKIHKYIETYRVNTHREFFKISKNALIKILVEELMLKLTPITEIDDTIISRKCTSGKKINEIKLLLKELETESHEFFSQLKKDKTKLVILEKNNKKFVSIHNIETEYSTHSLSTHGFENNDEVRIKHAYYFISRDIKYYKKLFDELINNYAEIKNNISIEQLKNDNKSFKKWILDTHKNLHNLKSEYEWDFEGIINSNNR